MKTSSLSFSQNKKKAEQTENQQLFLIHQRTDINRAKHCPNIGETGKYRESQLSGEVQKQTPITGASTKGITMERFAHLRPYLRSL